MNTNQSPTLNYRRARFATQLRLDYLYTPANFWLGRQADGSWLAGLTKFGSRLLGETVDYGFEAKPGAPVVAGQVIGWVEGFKAVSEVICLVTGQFVSANPALEQNANLINQDPYGAGWLYAVRGQPDTNCMSAEDYARLLDREIDAKLLGRAEGGS